MTSEERRRRRPIYLIIAILVASVLWVYVDEFGNNGDSFTTTKTFSNLPIEYVHEELLMDRGLMLMPDGTDDTFSITLEGTRRLISEIDPAKLVVTVDLSSVTAIGQQTIGRRVAYSGRNMRNRGISITEDMVKQTSPAFITVNIAELASKTIEIRCEVSGNVAEGYTAGQLQMSETSLEIWGEAENIEPIEYARVSLDIGADATESVSEKIPLTFYDAEGQVADTKHIRFNVSEVQITLPVSVTRELPLEMRLLETEGARRKNVRCEITPSTITVSGDASTLQNVSVIYLGDFALADLIKELGGQGTATYTYSITVPSGCTNLSGVTRATVRLSFVDMISKQVSVNRVAYENLPPDKTVEIRTQEVPVQIFGTTKDVNEITSANLVLMADLSDYSGAVGSYTIPAQVQTDTNGDIGVIGTYTVELIIREANDEEQQTTTDNTENLNHTQQNSGNALTTGNTRNTIEEIYRDYPD